MFKWLLYTATLVFAVYWVSNFLLWFPWSYNALLGITLILTASPVLWAYAMFQSLKTFPKKNLFTGAVWNAVVFVLLAAILDYFFFAVIRGAKEELYHPTTFYGYGFVIVLPFIFAVAFKKKINQLKKEITTVDFLKAGAVGFICLLALIIIIRWKIEI